jgi:hypothetical protein
MTIALGILAHDGVVLAADSQITQEAYLKTGRTKIIIGSNFDHPEHGVIAISGSGSLGYIDAARAEIVNAFMKNHDSSLAEFEEILKERVNDFYSRHVLPFASQDYRERPDFQLLIAA